MQRTYPQLPAAADRQSVRRGLLRWFRAHSRPLPWRRDRDPYRIWVAEVMLQQTQVAAVIPYYQRFLERFPDLSALARADKAEVLRCWEGLGYYRRARHLHAAARHLVERNQGRVPSDAESFAALPGVGRYTTGAVLSQAFNRRLPVVDGNVERVLARLFLCEAAPGTPGREAWLWQTAESLLPNRNVGDFNQALMELGQRVCTPRQPACLLCPLQRSCAARIAGLAERLPAPKPTKKLEFVREVAILLRRKDCWLVVRRPDQASRWAGLWEFPHASMAAREAEAEAASRVLAELTGLKLKAAAPLATLTHGVTRYRIQMHAMEAVHAGGRWRSSFYAERRWLRPSEFGTLPFSRPQRRLAQALLGRR